MADYITIKTLPARPYYEGTKSLDGIPYRLRFKWVKVSVGGTWDIGGVWKMEMTSLVDASVTLRGIVLLPGKDLFARYGYSHLLGQLWVEDTDGSNDNPDYYEMGTRWQLRYYPKE